jgi:hypothetical protein
MLFMSETSESREVAIVPSELVVVTPGSQPLRNPKHERFARLRATLRPKVEAFRQCGLRAATDKIAVDSAWRLEHRKDVADRISYLSRQDEELIKAKRARLEESLWHMLEADVVDVFETTEVPRLNSKGEPVLDKDGHPVAQKRQVVRDLQQVPPELRHAIESISVDAKGQTTAKLHNKLQANAELRKMLGLDKPVQQQSELDRLSDADLIDELAKQANELGVQIDLSYKFGEGD